MGFLSDKPYTAVTATIERLTEENYNEDDYSEIVDLVDIIRIRTTGPTEAARAIRKKLKYGTPGRQLRALSILEALVLNGGRDLTPLYCDEYLLERLRILATDNQTTPAVRKKVQGLFVGWSQDLNGQRGYERLAELYKQLPQRSRKARPQPKYLSNDPHELEEDEGESSSTGSAGPSSGARSRSNTTSGSGTRSRSNTVENHHTDKKKLKKQSKPAPAPLPRIDLAKERPKIQQTLAEASSAATNLMNALRLINWEQELSTDNKKATECFNKCRRLRKQVLRYIHSIESEEFIGSLLHTNEELIQALQKYDKMSQAPDEDSDSDYENDDWKVESGMRKLNVSDRRNQRDHSDTGSDVSDEEEDDDNPFGDSNKIKTPVDERAYIRY